MGLIRRLRRSVRSKANAVTKTFTAAGPSTTGTSNKSTPSAAGAATKPASSPARPTAPGAETAAVVTRAGLAGGRAGCGSGSGGGDSGGARGGVGGGVGAKRGASSDGSGDKGCDKRAPGPTPDAAETAPAQDGAAAKAVPALKITADAAAVQQLASQISELRAELANLRVTVQSLESRMGQGPTAPRRLPRAHSCCPETRSLVMETRSLSLEEGPNCVLKDEEFYDALATSLLHLEEESDKRNEWRRKKNEEMKEELRRQQEQEVSDDSKGMKDTNHDTRPHEEKESESDEQTKSKEEKAESYEESNDVKKSDDPTPSINISLSRSADPENNGEQQPPTTVSTPPPKPLRSLIKTPCLEEDTAGSATASSSPSSPGPSSTSAVVAAAAPAPQPPLPPAAAPRGGCSGNCSQLGHPLAAEIDRVITEQLGLVAADVSDGWTLFAQQGDMRMYRMEAPADNLSVDPLKAVSKAHGTTARELCRSYWDPDVRLEWETTVDRVTVLARPDPSTVVCHQLHRRIWPAQQRDTVFWSHLCRRQVGGTEWSITVNHSISGHPAEPPASPGTIRATMTATLAGRDEGEVSGDRRRLRCHVAYSAQVNPGGWAPTAGLRLVYKREYPRFLQRFTAYVTQKSRGQPVEV